MRILRFTRNHPALFKKSSIASATIVGVLLTGGLLSTTPALGDEDIEVASTSNASVRLDKPHPVKDLAYGEFLFDYYQEKYFTSISKAMIAEKRGLLKHHEAQTQVLLGSLYVGYGMLAEAESIFTNLLKESTAKSIRDKVWFHLAEVYYKRSNHDKTIEILTTHIDKPPRSLKNDIELLLAQSLIAKGELQEALTHLNKIKRKKGFSTFAKFNLASAHAILDEPEKAKALYLQVLKSRSKRKDRVATALKDRAALALGSNHLKSKDWDKARLSFESIKLDGPSSNTALLGLGWSYLNNNDPVGALAPWQELSRRSVSDPAVQEVMLNLPLVYEKAGALQDALDGYRAANEHYRKEFDKLAEVQKSIDNTDWIDSLTPPVTISLDPLDNVERFTLPENELSQYLYRFYASHTFQESFRDYRELQRLKQLLNHWQREVPVFNEMVDSNIERLNILQPQADAGIQKGQALLLEGTNKLVDFTARLNKAIEENDLTLTATDEQALLLDRLETLGKNLEKLPNIPDYDAERERFRVIKGVLLWDLNETAIERRWERTKDKVFIEGQLELLETRIQQVVSARARKLNHFDGYRTRIDELDLRLKDLQKKSLRGILHQRAYLKAIARNIITEHQQHVRNLQANAIFSIARLQDMAYIQSQEASKAPEQITPPPSEASDETTESVQGEHAAVLPTNEEDTRVPLEVEKRKSLFDGSFKSIFGIGD